MRIKGKWRLRNPYAHMLAMIRMDRCFDGIIPFRAKSFPWNKRRNPVRK